jgi:superfamily I DNA/RNA helicase
MAEQEKIFGAPGTGKTYNLIERLQNHLNKNCPFDQTLTLSFTRVAAREIRARIANQNQFTEKQLIQNVRTIDSYLMNRIREDKEICYTRDFIKAFYNVEKESSILDHKKYTFYTAMNILKMGRITIGDGIENILKYYDNLKSPQTSRTFLIQLVESYDNYKKNHLKMDWEDVKYKGLNPKIIFPNNIVLMIDEAQDCNRLEWLVINKLIAVSKHVYVAGDDDQAIYRFKGGEVETFLELPVTTTTVLDESPRLNEKIYNLAQDIIHYIPKERRQEKFYKPTNINHHNMPMFGVTKSFRNKETLERNYLNMNITDPDVRIHWLFLSRVNSNLDMRYSQEIFSWSQILAKNFFTWEQLEESNGHSTGLERATTPNIPPEQTIGIETWMKLQKGDKISGLDVKDFYRVLPASFIRERKKTALLKPDSIILKTGQYNYDDLKAKFYFDANINAPWSEILNLKPRNKDHYTNYIKYLETVVENGRHKKSKNILMSTIHGAKGLEAANVVLNTDWTKKSYMSYCKGGVWKDDEIRIFYVAVTRAKHNIFFYQPEFSYGEYKGMYHNNFLTKFPKVNERIQ